MTKKKFDESAWSAICEQCMIEAVDAAGLSEAALEWGIHLRIRQKLETVEPRFHSRALHIARDFSYLNRRELIEEHGEYVDFHK